MEAARQDLGDASQANGAMVGMMAAKADVSNAFTTYPLLVREPTVEAWTDADGTRNVLVLVQGAGGVHGFRMANGPRPGSWRVGVAGIEPGAPPRELPLRAALRADVEDMGFLGGPEGEARLAETVAGLAFAGQGLPPFRAPSSRAWNAPSVRGSGGMDLAMVAVHDVNEDLPDGNLRRQALRQLGLARSLPDHVRKSDFVADCETGPGLQPPDLQALGELDLPWRRRRPSAPEAAIAARQAYADAFRPVLAAALSTLAAPQDLAAFEILGREGWGRRAHESLAMPGRVGDRRRQAARLYPALAAVMATSPDVVAAIDAGRPFEGALRDRISELAHPWSREALTVAAVRRLRKLPADASFEHMAVAVEIAAQMPVDWLPSDGAGWRAAIDTAGTLLSETRALGTDLAGLSHHVGGDWAAVSGHRWLAETAPVPEIDAPPAFEAIMRAGRWAMATPQMVLRQALDVANRFSETLVRQVADSVGIAHDGNMVRAAGAVLFGGKSLPAVDRIQHDWHLGLSRLDAALPAHEALNSWPAAFPPFTASNGLVVACLTDEAQLKAEGMDGLDDDGMDGLDHCVGGYGRDCFKAASFIASVRRPAEDRWERVSTVEFEREARWGSFEPGDQDDDPDGTASLTEVQHMGLANSDPSPEAVHAVSELMEALEAGTHPLDREAIRARDDEGFLESYDWRVPGAMEAAFEAWRPHMPREVANGGLPALAERVAREAARHPDPPKAEGPDDGVGPAARFVLDIESCGLDPFRP